MSIQNFIYGTVPVFILGPSAWIRSNAIMQIRKAIFLSTMRTTYLLNFPLAINGERDNERKDE
jgi:hypothetical protein